MTKHTARHAKQRLDATRRHFFQEAFGKAAGLGIGSAALFGLMPSVCNALIILKPATVIAWHRAGLRAYWRWKSRPRGGRPRAPADVRPNLNACAERWARSVKEECLSKVILFGERSLR